jgi:hypothetical protein
MASVTQQAIGDKSDIQATVQQIVAQVAQFEQDEPGSREKLIQTARSLIQSLESPMESILWMIWSEVSLPNSTQNLTPPFLFNKRTRLHKPKT